MTQPVRRIVVQRAAGYPEIVGLESSLLGIQPLIGFRNFQVARLVQERKTYVLYRETAAPEDDGA